MTTRWLGGLVLACLLPMTGTARAQTEAAPAEGEDELVVPPPPPPEAPPPEAQPLEGQTPQVQLVAPQPPPPPVVGGPMMDPEQPPPRPQPTTRANWPLIAGGAIVWAASWIITAVGTSVWYGETTSCSSTGWFGYTCTHYGPDDYALGVSFVPLIGGWLMLGSDALDGADYIVPIFAGLSQTAGFVLFIVGLATPQDVEPRATLGEATLRAGLESAPGGGVVRATLTW